MAELSPLNVVINEKSVESKSADVNASHELETAAQGLHMQQTQPLPPHDDHALLLDSKLSQDHPHLNGAINRDADNATPDQLGSDTDSSRPDGPKLAVKKPLSFKPVSITKSFLAKAATTPGNTPPPVKIAEKRAPTIPSSS